MVLLSIVSLFVFGFRIGIDFKGGALVEVVYKTNRPAQSDLDAVFKALDFGSVLIQPTGELGYIVKSLDLNEAQHSLLLKTLSQDGKSPLEEKNFNSIGPSVGRELTRKAIIAIVLVSLAIILFIAFAFRKVSRPVSSWKYGLMAIVSLLHDVIIPIGLFSILSRFYGAEVDTLFVVAVLTILGLSVSDTIVIFDRIRENLRNKTGNSFGDTVGKMRFERKNSKIYGYIYNNTAHKWIQIGSTDFANNNPVYIAITLQNYNSLDGLKVEIDYFEVFKPIDSSGNNNHGLVYGNVKKTQDFRYSGQVCR